MYDVQHLDVIDLLSERHFQLRRVLQKMWNDTSDIPISNSEWFIMARIYRKQPTIAFVTKHVDITRQATHKLIKSLESKGLVVVSSLENNKKDKMVQLTKLGEESYEKNEALKATVVKNMEDQVGSGQIKLLVEFLKKDWKF